MNILLVEDNRDVLCLLEEMLGRLGHDTRACNSGESALVAFQKDSYPLVLIDFGLPWMNGLELSRRIRAFPEGKDCFIILITGVLPPENLHLALDAGIDDYLTKPIALDLLNIRLEIAERRIHDRLQRRRAEEALQQSEANMKAILNNNMQAFLLVDRRHRILACNRLAYERNLLFPGKPLHVGKKIFDFVSDDKRDEIAQHLAVVFQGETRRTEGAYTHSTGQEVWNEVDYNPVFTDTGEVIGACIGILDITERKQAEVELQKAKETAEDLNEAKREFLADMGHELRTPLNSLLGYAQILAQASNLTVEQRNMLTMIRSSGEYLLTMMTDILDLSKIEARKIELIPRETDLLTLLKTIVDLVRIQVHNTAMTLMTEFTPDLPPKIYADSNRLRQVLVNLLINAVKFTHAGTVVFRVNMMKSDSQVLSLTFQRVTRTIRLHFEVEDTGIGIHPDHLDVIFFPFHRLHDHRLQAEGSGLGLAISQRLVQLMGGSIHVKSTLGKGSVFWFDLDLPEIKEGDSIPAGEHADSRRIIGFTGPPKKILLADDKKANRALLKHILMPLGFDVQEAENGCEVLQQVDAFQPDMIFMDLVMPKMDGLEATNRLRQHPVWKDVVIVAVSASVYNRTLQESLEAGCDDFITKPVYRDDLLRVLQIHLHIEWRYDGKMESDASPQFFREEHGPVPAKEHLQPLLEAVMIGDISALQDQLTHLETMEQHFQPFVTKLWHLARNFELDQIQQCLEHWIVQQ